jgi:hypothetical protein
MTRIRPLMLVQALVFSLIATVMAATVAGAQQPLTIQLNTQNNSGISGTATLTPVGTTQTRVVLTLQGSPADANHPAHIHTSNCATIGGVVYPLTNVRNGTSETVINATIAQIRAAQHSLNVHKSPQEASVYVACGDLPTGAATGMPRTGAGGAHLPNETLAGLGVVLVVIAGGLTLLRRRAA